MEKTKKIVEMFEGEEIINGDITMEIEEKEIPEIMRLCGEKCWEVHIYREEGTKEKKLLARIIK